MNAVRWLVSLTIAASALTAFASPSEGWSTDLNMALKKAKVAKKAVLVEFTGSDWCPPCIAMRKNVFSKNEFVAAASKNYILVEVDFPRGHKGLADKNQPLAEKYMIEALPTVILLDSTGKEFTRFFAADYPKIDVFLKHLNGALEKRNR